MMKGFREDNTLELDEVIAEFMDTSRVFQDQFTGFLLWDPEEEKPIFSHHADKLFVPASNTKLLTLFTGLNFLRDSMPAFEYCVHGDSIIISGTAYPALLDPLYRENRRASEFLDTIELEIFLDLMDSPERFGPGWAWDDYKYGYQAERSVLPLYANQLEFRFYRSGEMKVYPDYFLDHVQHVEDDELWVERKETENIFLVGTAYRKMTRDSIVLHRPFIWSEHLTADLLSDTLKRDIDVLAKVHECSKEKKEIFDLTMDSLYVPMIRDSDNFIAEQILLACANAWTGSYEIDTLIEFVTDSLLLFLPHEFQWVDGSGLSRYNMTTPGNMVALLDQLWDKLGEEKIRLIFPAGGVNGTIENYYQSDPPYIYAKTGTLRNHHALSGFIFTTHRKRYVFSFMNSNYVGNSLPVKREMEKVLNLIREYDY